METAKRQKGPRGSERILYVSDPSSIARKLLPDPVREEDLRNWVDMVAASGVDLFGQEVFSMGWTPYWRSATYEYDQRPQHRRFLPLIEAGLEPLEILIDQTHRRGMRFVAGIRVNDNHAHQAREQGVGIAEFIDANPQLQLRDFPEGEYYKLSDPLDFSFEEVREFTLGVSRELAARFDIDGIDAAHKLAILASLAFGSVPDFDSVYTEGISHITPLDTTYAAELNYRIKLLGLATVTDHGLEQRVHPCMVPVTSPIAQVEGVFNAVITEGDFVDSTMFSGRGAGGGPRGHRQGGRRRDQEEAGRGRRDRRHRLTSPCPRSVHGDPPTGGSPFCCAEIGRTPNYGSALPQTS